MDTKAVIEFADEICEDAKGNLTKMNRLAGNKALKFYLDNVVMLGTMTRATYATCYPQFMEEIEELRQRAVKVEEAETQHVDQGDRIAALEAKMDKLATALEKFMETTEAPVAEEPDEETDPEPAPKKRAPKKTGEEPAEPAADTTAEETDAE